MESGSIVAAMALGGSGAEPFGAPAKPPDRAQSMIVKIAL